MSTPVGRVISAAKKSSSIQNYVFPKDIGPHGLLMIFKKYTYSPTKSVLTTIPTATVGASVMLPLPRQLMDNTSVRINRYDLGILGSGIAGAMAEGKGSIEALQNSISDALPSASATSDAIGTAIKNVMGFNGDGKVSGQFVDQLNFLARRMASGSKYGAALDVGLGSAINPKQALAFEGVNMREYEFDFELMPRNEEESDSIKRIANLIRYYSLPSYNSLKLENSTIAQNVFLEYPATVDMYLLGVDASHYFYFKPCMIQRFTTNLTPTGGQQHAILAGGKPAMVTFSISLAEMDIRTREDYEDLKD